MRLAAVTDGEIVGLGAIDVTAACGPELVVAVAEPWRGQGVAGVIAQVLVQRADAAGVERIVMHTNGPSAGVRSLGAALGFQLVDLGAGRLDLLRMLSPARQTA
jgi:N-acetylglutamate synthase-like GNAT family acetyltransferase